MARTYLATFRSRGPQPPAAEARCRWALQPGCKYPILRRLRPDCWRGNLFLALPFSFLLFAGFASSRRASPPAGRRETGTKYSVVRIYRKTSRCTRCSQSRRLCSCAPRLPNVPAASFYASRSRMFFSCAAGLRRSYSTPYTASAMGISIPNRARSRWMQSAA